MATMSWTNEWTNGGNTEDVANKEYLFLINNSAEAEPLSDIKVEQISVRGLAETNQQKFVF